MGRETYEALIVLSFSAGAGVAIYGVGEHPARMIVPIRTRVLKRRSGSFLGRNIGKSQSFAFLHLVNMIRFWNKPPSMIIIPSFSKDDHLLFLW